MVPHGQIKSMLRRIVAIPMLSVVGLIVISLFQAAYLRTYQNRVDHSTDVILRAQKLKAIAIESENSLQALWIAHTPENIAKSKAAEKEFDDIFKGLDNLVPDSGAQANNLQEIHDAYQEWRKFKSQSESEASRYSVNSLDEIGFYKSMSQHSRRLSFAFDNFIRGERSLRAAQGDTTHLLANALILSVCLISLAIGVIFSIFGRNALFQISSSYARVIESEKHTQEKLRSAVNARDEFFSMASHELKTPITSLKLQLQMLDRNMRPDSKRRPTNEQLVQSFELALRQVNALNDLVEDMLDTSRIQTGNFVLSKSDVNLSDLINDIVTRLRAQLKSAGILVTRDLKSNLIGHWDRHRLEQVVVNLLTNAIRYASGTPVHISTSTDEFGARLIVKDSGPGIELEKQDRIFDRFERANGTNKAGGLGLGLFIVRKIVEAHGGTVTVKSRPEDGASFIVHLPLDDRHTTVPRERSVDASV